MTGLLIIAAGLLITKGGSRDLVTLSEVTGVIAQTVIITRVITAQDLIIPDQTPGLITGVTIRGLTPTEAFPPEDPIAVIVVVIPLGDQGPVAVTPEAIPLPEEVLHQNRLEADPAAVHLTQLEKGKIKIPE